MQAASKQLHGRAQLRHAALHRCLAERKFMMPRPCRCAHAVCWQPRL